MSNSRWGVPEGQQPDQNPWRQPADQPATGQSPYGVQPPPGSDSSQHGSGAKKLLVVIISLLAVALFGIAAALYFMKDEPVDVRSDFAVGGTTTSSSKPVAPKPADETSTTTTETSTKTSASKTGGDAAGSKGERCAEGNFSRWIPNNIVVMYCDGEWAEVGKARSDHIVRLKWEDGDWASYQPDGETMSGFPCFDEYRVDSDGMPSGMRGDIPLCEDSTQAPSSTGLITSVDTEFGTRSAESQACDGSYVLITASVFDDANAKANLSKELSKDSDLVYSYPGECSSFRKETNGTMIYPVYFHFGSDRDAMCAAKSTWGGNGRTLNSNGDLSDPC
ncbi:hypothetical protein [Corynebacterium sp. H78]|uniref:hypothetical protein n=1 Tax=Corynebacterium sp. H78 TaxID=3133417 RepID=UPI0030A54C8A